jgi:actin-related protein 2
MQADSSKVICDNGSGFMKIGFCGENFPTATIPAIVGRPLLRADQKIGEVELKSLMVGDEANPLRSYLEIDYPIQEGIVKNWDDMCSLWEHSFFNRLNLPKDLSNHSILITEAALNPKQNRVKMADIMFEKFGFGHIMFQMQALCALYAEGQMTGMVLDAGDGVSHCIPVYEGVPFTN